MPVRDPHAVLGVSADASDDQIHQAYRSRAKETHPDRNNGARKAFDEVRDAYESLKTSRANGGGLALRTAPLATAFDSFFDTIGKHERSRTVKPPVQPARPSTSAGAAGETVVEITLEQAYKGGRVHVVRDGGMCDGCGGKGRIRTQRPQPCIACGGVGYVNAVQGFITVRNECGTCEGTGRTTTCSCPECGGEGRGTGFEADIDIPEGCRDGFAISPEDLRGVRIVVKVKPHDVFQRHPRRIEDLVATLPLPIWDAALGCVHECLGVDGEALQVVVPKGSWQGDEIRVVQRGMPAFSGRGDAVFKIRIERPADDDETQSLLERMRDRAERH